MKTIQFITKVYSDREIERPEAYFNAVFGWDNPIWELVEVIDNCMTVESVSFECETDGETLDKLYKSVTPEMYESTSRAYRVLR